MSEAASVGEPRLVIDLPSPVEIKSGRYDRLDLREPTLHDTIQVAACFNRRLTPSVISEAERLLIAQVSKWPEDAVSQLDDRIFSRAVEYLQSFERSVRRAEGDAPDLSDELVIDLAESYSGAGRTFSQLSLRPPIFLERLRYEQQTDAGGVQAVLRAEKNIVQTISGWTDAALLALPISIFARGADYVTGFFSSGRPTGGAWSLISR